MKQGSRKDEGGAQDEEVVPKMERTQRQAAQLGGQL
jgi:hypothetical protein